ncbi:CRISPR-associated endonuclease Cas1 [Deinococcus aquiradiocola]|nr:CRISPR-associated endonuclease Cas1 [Deinococcus aquiradiocola]
MQRQGTVLGVLGGTLRLTLHGEELARFPADLVEEVLLFGGVSVTTPALRDLLSRGAALHYLTMGGRHLGSLHAGLEGHAGLLRAQVNAERPDLQWPQARAVLHAKLHNTRAVLRRWQTRQPHPALAHAVQAHTDTLSALDTPDPLAPPTLLGLEGTAAATYFAALAATLPAAWGFHGRARRPPPDPVNALLSFGYSVLHAAVLSDIQRVGLHPGFAVLHAPHGRRPVLALDLMEPHRAALVDRTVLACINRHLLNTSHFEASSEGVRLNADGRRRFLTELNARLSAPVGRTGPTYRDLLTRNVRRYAEAVRAGRVYTPDLLR